MSESHSRPVSPASSQKSRSSRVLSCVLCQHRKIKCDRTFPCKNCTRSQADCVPAGLTPRRRKRRFAERELLDRLQQYETILRQNDIKFDPLHGDVTTSDGPENIQRLESNTRPSSSSAAPDSSNGLYDPKSFWNAINQTSRESDGESNSPPNMTETVVTKAWNQVYGSSDPLFGSHEVEVDLASLHPAPSQILRLWQIYLENVDPLFKVTHTPTLQARIIEAIGNLKDIKPALGALMFSIYCVATMTLLPQDCQELFALSKDQLVNGYHRSCRQALVQSGFLCSDDRDCLTALYLYLVSLRPCLDPRTLSCMLGIAVRSAQRMGLHRESDCARHSPLEAEMRRRLWWALVLFDARIGEMADHRTSTLTPLWDCKIPLNVNDFDLRPEMKAPPVIQGCSSEALFAVVRSRVGDFIRNSSFHLDFTCPALKIIARKNQQDATSKYGELVAIEKLLEEQYLQFCDPENPVHFMTIWTTRVSLAKCHLIEHYSKHPAGRQTDAQRAEAISHALRMLECDTKLITSRVTAGRYYWLMNFHFPFPAYIHLLQDLRRRPLSDSAERSWITISENFEARANWLRQVSPGLLFRTMTGIVFHAWGVRESELRKLGHSPRPPKIVSLMKHSMAQHPALSESEKASRATEIGTQVAPWPAQAGMNLDPEDPLLTINENTIFPGSESWMRFDLSGQLLDDSGQMPDISPFLNMGSTFYPF
ncbi:hypothetical protein BJX99DRAFT_189353 [Aspergillus californicus]